jgi:hypothetical protein
MRYIFLAFAAWHFRAVLTVILSSVMREKVVLTKDSAGMLASDPPLAEPGKVRAFVLGMNCRIKNIRYIFYRSTCVISVRSSLFAKRFRGRLIIYNPSKDSLEFYQRLKSIKKGKCTVVGHSNTVDDIVNQLCGKNTHSGDLKDWEHDNMYITAEKE